MRHPFFFLQRIAKWGKDEGNGDLALPFCTSMTGSRRLAPITPQANKHQEKRLSCRILLGEPNGKNIVKMLFAGATSPTERQSPRLKTQLQEARIGRSSLQLE